MTTWYRLQHRRRARGVWEGQVVVVPDDGSAGYTLGRAGQMGGPREVGQGEAIILARLRRYALADAARQHVQQPGIVPQRCLP